MNKAKILDVDKYYLRAKPGSIDVEARTVEVMFTSGFRGLRPGFFSESYYEELEVSKKAVRTGRLLNGAAVLFGHDSRSLDSLVGVVESFKINDKEGQGFATVRFDTDPASDRVFNKVRNGVLRSVSVGYMVYRYEELDETVEDLRVFRAVDWEPAEISFVSVPFDPDAQVRNENNLQIRSKCSILFKEGESMPRKKAVKRSSEEVETPAAEAEEVEVEATPAAEAEEVEVEVEATPAAESEASVSSIMRSCVRAKLDTAETAQFVRDFQSNKFSLVQVRERIIEAWENKDRKVVGAMDTVEAGSYDKMSVVVDGITNAILHRVHPEKYKLDEKGRSFRGRSLVEMGREYLENVGIPSRDLTRSEVAAKIFSLRTSIHVRTGFMGTSDFPSILANVANKTLLDAYDRSPQTFRSWTSKGTAPDFKTISRTRLGEGPALTKVTEHGEFTYGSFGEGAESYALATYGKIIPFTRQSMINDDLNAFDRVTTALGLNAAALESDIVYAILTANAALSDGVALFHATHKNLGTSGVISETTLSEARKLGRKQTGIDDQKLNVFFAHLIVPVALETTAQKQISAITADQTGNVNVFQGAYKIVTDPRLDDSSEAVWYMAANPGMVDTIEYSFLEGNESVFVDQEVEFDTDGMSIKVRHDFAAKALDHRGMFKNAGV